MTFKPAKPKPKLPKAKTKSALANATTTHFSWLLKDGVVLSCIGLALFFIYYLV